jgi:hypothetical protein
LSPRRYEEVGLVARTKKTTQQDGEGKQNSKSEPGELSQTELDQVAGGVVGGALTASKPAVPWAIFKE